MSAPKPFSNGVTFILSLSVKGGEANFRHGNAISRTCFSCTLRSFFFHTHRSQEMTHFGAFKAHKTYAQNRVNPCFTAIMVR